MSSRFRSNWAKGARSTSPIFDFINRNCANNEERTGEYNDNHHRDCPDESTIEIGNADGRLSRDRSIGNRNGKLRDRSGPVVGCYGDERESLENDRASPEWTYHGRSSREDFRCRGETEVDDCPLPRERRTSSMIGKKSGFAIGSTTTARYDLVDNGATEDSTTIVEPRLPTASSSSAASLTLMTMTATTTTTTSSRTNGNSSMRNQPSNGSAKQVKRIEARRDNRATIGSLTREERPSIGEKDSPTNNTRSNDATNRSYSSVIRTDDSGNGSKRDRSAKRSVRNDRGDDSHGQVVAGGRGGEIDDYGSMDRGGMRHSRERSYSPIERARTNGGSNGDSLNRRRRDHPEEERLYSPGRGYDDDKDFGSIDRRSRRRAEERSYSPFRDIEDSTLNGNTDFSSRRSTRRCSKDDEAGSATRRFGRGRHEERFQENDDNANTTMTHRTNGNRGENGIPKKYSEVDDDDSQGRKLHYGRKSHHKALPEDFDVQIHRYERGLRGPRRDSDLSRKSSFKDHESDLSRKSSFDERQRPRDFNAGKKSTSKIRDSEINRRGSSEDRDQERVSRKSSFRCHYEPETTRKSRNLLDTGPNNNNNNNNNINSNNNINNHNKKNGSHQRDKSESSRRDREASITRRRSLCNDENEDQDASSWRNDRHSRPLTPPKIQDRNDSRDRRGRMSSSSRERNVLVEDDFSRNYEHNRGKPQADIGKSLVETQGRDRVSSSTRRVSSTRSYNESRQDNIQKRNGGKNVDDKTSTRDVLANVENHSRDDEPDPGFSTIERNGTTVIRIRTNSESPPVGHAEPRTRRRTSHREVNSATRYRKYEDEAEDEEEDDEIYERNSQRRDYRIGPRRLWSNRDGGVQITDLDDGQPCLHCGETCPGFSPHSWRKNCTSCKCPREAHDVCHEEWVSVRARLGLKGEGPNNYVGFDPRDRGLTWAPPGLPPSKVEEYFSMLPEISVPRIGTLGERHRDRQLATQLPKQDLARAYCRHLDTQHSASADDFMAARNEIALDIGSVKEILERGHECGVCHEPLKYGSLVVSASKLGLSYHPSCFQCTQCRELLVDLAYCVHDDALYCERHYAEQLKPRCAACDELIFSGEYTKAMNKDWHSGHFCCWQCDESLTGQRYVLRDEHPYCIKCYESVFANGCEECSKIIGIDSKDLSYKDKHWHEACFLCNKCRVSLVDKQFGSKVDKIYCGNCYDAQFASRCDGCGEIFRAGTKKMEYKTRQWHEKCFCCVVCKNPIGTKSFIPREQEIYCAGCYEDKFATRCVKCNKIITSGGVTYKNEPWHRDCFTCSNCNNSLAGQRFTSRDEKPYCAECFGELFAKRCTACTKPITGIGGTRFISFEDRHWHNNCFICAGCNTSLVGRGFITDGDDIICPECAKQKLSE